MDTISQLLNHYLIEAFGWTIVHSIWQIALWAIVAVTLLILTHKRKANIRYFLLSVVLLGICISSVITFKKYIPAETISKTGTVRKEIPAYEVAGQRTIISRDIFQLNESALQRKWKIVHKFRDYFETHIPGIVTLWFLGFVFLFLRYLGGVVWLMRLKGSYESTPDHYQSLMYKLCRKLHMRRIVDIGTTIRINVPVTIGHMKPIILLPARLLTGLTNDQLETILLHELAHIKRNDFLINLIQGFVEVVFFYHPAIWWLSAEIRTEREHACDDLALKGGADTITLAQTLAGLAVFVAPPPVYSQAFSGKQHTIKNRIHRLILTEKMKTNSIEKVLAAMVIIVTLAALSLGMQTDNRGNSLGNVAIESVRTDPQAFDVREPVITDTVETITLVTQEEEQTELNEPVLSENITSDEVDEVDEGDDENSGLVLFTLMKQGAKEWNNYRKEHPEENFEEVLKESDLSGLDLSNFNLSLMNLKEATLINTNFTNADMAGINIKEANVKGAIFEKADLSDSDMKELSMNGNNLKNVILKGANLKEISLINCDLSGADLSGCNMAEATIENCRFNGATANTATLFPAGFDWSEQGIKLK